MPLMSSLHLQHCPWLPQFQGPYQRGEQDREQGEGCGRLREALGRGCRHHQDIRRCSWARSSRPGTLRSRARRPPLTLHVCPRVPANELDCRWQAIDHPRAVDRDVGGCGRVQRWSSGVGNVNTLQSPHLLWKVYQEASMRHYATRPLSTSMGIGGRVLGMEK